MKASLSLSGTIAAIIACTSCSSGPKGAAQPEQYSTTSSVQPAVPGGTAVQTYQETDKVVGIDRDARTIVLRARDGTERTVKAGPEVVNFDQIEVGDNVKATYTEQLVISVRDSKEPPTTSQTSTVNLSPVGAKPGIMKAETIEMTAKIIGIDPQNRTATVQFPDGTTKTFPVRNDIDLSKHTVGEQVVLTTTESMAISVEKP